MVCDQPRAARLRGSEPVRSREQTRIQTRGRYASEPPEEEESATLRRRCPTVGRTGGREPASGQERFTREPRRGEHFAAARFATRSGEAPSWRGAESRDEQSAEVPRSPGLDERGRPLSRTIA